MPISVSTVDALVGRGPCSPPLVVGCTLVGSLSLSYSSVGGLPFEMTYCRPLNALPACWQVFPAVPQRPAPLLAPRRRIAFHKTVRRHPPAPRFLPPRHGSLKLQDDVLPSAKHPLDVLASFSNGSTMPCPPPGPKTTYLLPLNSQTSPSSFQKPSTSPWASQTSRRRIVVR